MRHRQHGFVLIVLLAVLTGLLSSGYLYFLYQKSAEFIAQERIITQNIHLAREAIHRRLMSSVPWSELMDNWTQSKEYELLLASSGHSALTADKKLRINIQSAKRASRIASQLAAAESDEQMVYVNIRDPNSPENAWVLRVGAPVLMNSDTYLSGHDIKTTALLEANTMRATQLYSREFDAQVSNLKSLQVQAADTVSVDVSNVEAGKSHMVSGNSAKTNSYILNSDRIQSGNINTKNLYSGNSYSATGFVSEQINTGSLSADIAVATSLESSIATTATVEVPLVVSDSVSATAISSNSLSAGNTAAGTVVASTIEAQSTAAVGINTANALFTTADVLSVTATDVVVEHDVFLYAESGSRLDAIAANLTTLNDQLFYCVEISRFCISPVTEGQLNFISCEGCIDALYFPYFTAEILFYVEGCVTHCSISLQFSEYFTAVSCSPNPTSGSGQIQCVINHHMAFMTYFSHEAVFELYESSTGELLDTETVQIIWTSLM